MLFVLCIPMFFQRLLTFIVESRACCESHEVVIVKARAHINIGFFFSSFFSSARAGSTALRLVEVQRWNITLVWPSYNDSGHQLPASLHSCHSNFWLIMTSSRAIIRLLSGLKAAARPVRPAPHCHKVSPALQPRPPQQIHHLDVQCSAHNTVKKCWPSLIRSVRNRTELMKVHLKLYCNSRGNMWKFCKTFYIL